MLLVVCAGFPPFSSRGLTCGIGSSVMNRRFEALFVVMVPLRSVMSFIVLNPLFQSALLAERVSTAKNSVFD